MKASELMIGDYVNYRGQIIKVTSIYDKGGSNEVGWSDKESVWVNADNVEPIALTPEILEKNGFRHGCYVGGYYSPDCPFRVFTKTEGTCGFTTLFDDEIHFSCIFVHQLQHALSLCGIEKEIEL